MPALLLVYSEPGSAVPLEEFNDWYDNDHVPLCIPIPSFHSWSRWVAADDKKPAHLALYDVDSPDAVNDIPYASFTPRDHAILSQLALVDRRTYTLHEPVHPRAAYSSLAPGPLLSSVEMDIPAEQVAEFDRWCDEEHVPLVAKIPEWVRTRRFVFADASPVLGTDEGLTQSLRQGKEGPQRFLTLHEWESAAALGTEEYEAAIAAWGALKFTGLATRFEQRLFKLHRAWGRE
ncbi:hypothetical protein GSI_08628 [Ganoderma sinense ZZ0214-1]|uniref:EthD domain-containing protein n=1 Tax=Ganoderma sinense ZZ0214-1 TaxID=1077348 RepID=A0A2G8S4D4_9APHY|nr:hypothetical protein GSI_08628 [Ganoderma sinense ZZ0214-1]